MTSKPDRLAQILVRRGRRDSVATNADRSHSARRVKLFHCTFRSFVAAATTIDVDLGRNGRPGKAVMTGRVWFITGTSRGFGRIWAQAALERGDRLAATARDLKTLLPLVERYGERVAAIALDVTDKAAVHAAVSESHQ